MNTVQACDVRRIEPHQTTLFTDNVVCEEPLEIRIEGRSVAVLMRTPGSDIALAAGFLYTENVIESMEDIQAIAHVDDPRYPRGNTVDVLLSSGVPRDKLRSADRSFVASSACGVCGKTTIDRIFLQAPPLSISPSPSPEIILSLPLKLRKVQPIFEQTGGIHAAGLFSLQGELLIAHEDVGRHNATDKIIGELLQNDQLPAPPSILLLSGRVGFEIIQKAIFAQIPVVAGIGAPTSLAVSAAQKANVHLIGFLSSSHYNLYQGERL